MALFGSVLDVDRVALAKQDGVDPIQLIRGSEIYEDLASMT